MLNRKRSYQANNHKAQLVVSSVWLVTAIISPSNTLIWSSSPKNMIKCSFYASSLGMQLEKDLEENIQVAQVRL